jgi:hypothetical protein
MNEGPSGFWRSVCTYESSSRGEVLTDERDVVFSVLGSRVRGGSLPGPSPSRLEMDLEARGRMLTGTWLEETDPDGYYGGITFRGAVQFIVSEDRQSMSGRWVGHSRNLTEVNTGTWTLTLAGDAG